MKSLEISSQVFVGKYALGAVGEECNVESIGGFKKISDIRKSDSI